ncbi:hypothetical protein E2562_012447 [Oryza meyeriana var. granulata]|uniref:Uncharacterized protein n=1 Tax=Oryza meyeriana var. granulata TaxID=110450 RepID=A0A6G1C5C0_9ORYZ|nr:hypothetical protein E2562_012447 [Oryza meyeriana var. granulata]
MDACQGVQHLVRLEERHQEEPIGPVGLHVRRGRDDDQHVGRWWALGGVLEEVPPGVESSLLSPTGRVGASSGLGCETTVFGLLGSSCGGVIIIGHRRRAGGHVTTPGDGVTTGMGEQLRADRTSVRARR